MTVWRRIACCIRKATRPCPCTHTHSHTCVILIGFHDNSGYRNAPLCYVIRTLPVLLVLYTRRSSSRAVSRFQPPATGAETLSQIPSIKQILYDCSYFPGPVVCRWRTQFQDDPGKKTRHLFLYCERLGSHAPVTAVQWAWQLGVSPEVVSGRGRKVQLHPTVFCFTVRFVVWINRCVLKSLFC